MSDKALYRVDNSLEPYREERWSVVEFLHSERSEFQLIEVVRLEKLGLTLFLDGGIQFSEFDEAHYHEMFVHPAAGLLEPSRVLILGGGDGGCVREVLKHPSVKEVHVVEIDRKVVEVCQRFFPTMAGSINDNRVRIIYEDAVRVVETIDGVFDLILVDLTDLGPLSAKLYTHDFYKNLKKLLDKQGAIVTQTSGIYYQDADPFNLDGFISGISRLFNNISVSYVPIHSFPGGDNSFTYMSDSVHFATAKFSEVNGEVTWYTAEYAEATFKLPKVFKFNQA